MGICSQVSIVWRASAMVLLLSWLMMPAGVVDGGTQRPLSAHNPVRDGELPFDDSELVPVPEPSAPPRPLVDELPAPATPSLPPTNGPAVQSPQAARPLSLEVLSPTAEEAPRPAPMALRHPEDLTGVNPAAAETGPNPSMRPPEAESPDKAVRFVQVSAPVAETTSPPAPAGVPSPSGPSPAIHEEMPPEGLTPLETNEATEIPPSEIAWPGMWQASVPPCRCGVACPPDGCRRSPHWRASQPIPWQVFAQGEYVGPARPAHVPQYQLRVDDIIRVVYGLTGAPSSRPYDLNVGDIIHIESLTSPTLDRQVPVQPDGMVTVRLLGPVPAAGRSIEDLSKDLEARYSAYVHEPAISIVPVKLNTRVEELRASVDQRYGTGGQGIFVRVTPAGFIQLPAIGSVPVQGLTLDEVKREIEARYVRRFHGIEVTPVLDHRAPRYVFVIGEVKTPGRFELEGPTTVIQAIAMAGSWNVGADLHHIVVLRRDECWRLMATRLDLHGALLCKHPCPPDEIWLRDSDVVLVAKSALLLTDDFIQLAFTRGLYGVVPFSTNVSWTNLTSL